MSLQRQQFTNCYNRSSGQTCDKTPTAFVGYLSRPSVANERNYKDTLNSIEGTLIPSFT